ncbi:MAG: HD domain-containing protein [Candidatus Omnitrophica bacterium]|nr:HD domain-containing protein [Candidatus Omnitrophota bacterium]
MLKLNPSKIALEVFSALTYAVDAQRSKNLYHAWKVAILSTHFAKSIKNPRKIKEVFYAALLHDVGGVGFPFHIVHYLKRNDKVSRDTLLSHPIIGAQLISNIPQMGSVAKLILDHHEWINGQGYPRAKTAKYIPWGSQVIRLADTIDTALQTEKIDNLNTLKNKLSLNVNKEYSKDLFEVAFKILNKDGLFKKIISYQSIPYLFNETKENVGLIYIPQKIDAVGTVLEVTAQIIDMRHPYSAGHSLRVSRYAMACALAMRLEHDEVTKIKWAGLIHDIGKIIISRKVLEKPSVLTAKEYTEVKRHSSLTQEILKMVTTLKEIAPIAASHHEYYDGSGYPQGLKGDLIPLGARILAICDAFDAMTSNRPYRKPLSHLEACKELEKLSGKQFDPEIVKQTLPIFKNLGI